MIMPMGKGNCEIENIIREEMECQRGTGTLDAGFEFPEDVYVQSGRRDAFGSNMFSLNDRYMKRYV